ncbi:hypothetical protein [Streptomyces sp. NPDC048266]|uniref:hypothetical protein n=1 Tax=Streptomyces sp. NPDC048266 TaxID=3155787 RepID=UPI00340B4CE2
MLRLRARTVDGNGVGARPVRQELPTSAILWLSSFDTGAPGNDMCRTSRSARGTEGRSSHGTVAAQRRGTDAQPQQSCRRHENAPRDQTEAGGEGDRAAE